MKKYFTYFVLVVVALSFGACHAKKKPSISGTPPLVSGLKTIYFDFDKSNIREDQVSSMQNNSQQLKSQNTRVVIEGHCDERGTNEYNMALGDRRANASRDYLVNLGVDPSKMNTVSYGEERPACTESDESCWGQNRRDEFRKQ